MADISERVQSALTAIDALTTEEQRQLASIIEDRAVIGQETRELRTICDRLFELGDILMCLLESRNRKSHPKTLEKEKQIFSLRKKDPRRWSWKQLRKKFHFKTTRGAQKAVERHKSRLEFHDLVRHWYDQTAPDVPLTEIIAFVDEQVCRYKKAN